MDIHTRISHILRTFPIQQVKGLAHCSKSSAGALGSSRFTNLCIINDDDSAHPFYKFILES